MYANARGLRSKIASLEAATLIYKPDVILIAESHIRGKTTICLKGYNEKVLRNRKHNGGGLLIIKSGFLKCFLNCASNNSVTRLNRVTKPVCFYQYLLLHSSIVLYEDCNQVD